MTDTQQRTSVSPPRRSLSESISAFGAKLGRSLSKGPNDGSSLYSASSTAKGSEPDSQARSVSRGREYISSGRGGIGNIKRSVSGTREIPQTGEDAVSPARGREASIDVAQKVTHVGRGGAGNVRSPSREPVNVEERNAIAERERALIEKYDNDPDRIISTGRGGAGNIRDPSRSRSRARESSERSSSRGRPLNAVHSSGRGGAGNMTALGDDFASLEIKEEEERRGAALPEGIHSTGRGGAANLTADRSPSVEHSATRTPDEVYSSGRGGAGNIRNRSESREPGGGSRGISKDGGHHHHEGLGHKLLDSVAKKLHPNEVPHGKSNGA